MNHKQLSIRPEERGITTVKLARRFMAGRYVARLSQPRKWYRLTAGQITFYALCGGIAAYMWGLWKLLNYYL